MMHHHQQHLFWIQKFYLILPFQIQTEMQDLCSVTWKIFLQKTNVKSILHENTHKIFPTRHQRMIRDWGIHSSWWICVHKNYQGNIWTESGIHYSLQTSHFSYGTAQLLSSGLHNWTLGTQDQKDKIILCVDDSGENNSKMMQITS